MNKIFIWIMFLFITFFSSQVFAQSISGQLNYGGTETGDVHIVWAAAAPGPSCDTVDWSDSNNVNVGPAASFPFSYGPVALPADGQYCVAAYIDSAPSGYPPDLGDPVGVYSTMPGSITPFAVSGATSNIDITVSDPGTVLVGAWNVTANVAIGAPLNIACLYSGLVGIWHDQLHNVLIGSGSVASSTPACLPYSPQDITIFCDTTSYPALTNCTIGGDIGPYTGLATTVSPNGNFANGIFNGSLSGTDYTVNWFAYRQSIDIPTLTELGVIIFIAFAGIGAVYYLRRQKRAAR